MYIFHYTYLWYPILRNGYGASDSDNLFWQLPIIRVLHSGAASVTVFFIISGYVLTIKCLTLIYAGQHNKSLETLSGSLFRRPFRLYLPIIAATGIIAVLVRLQLFQGNPVGDFQLYKSNSTAPIGVPPYEDTAADQFWHWWWSVLDVINLFRSIPGRLDLYYNPYDSHLWTIPTEFKGSILVFLLVLAFSQARTWVRMTGVALAGGWQVLLGDFDQSLFCAGLFFAELSIILPPSSRPLLSRYLPTQLLYIIRHVTTMALFILSLHLLSFPEDHGPVSPGFRTLSQYVPTFYQVNEGRTHQFWISIGSLILTFAVMYSPPLLSRSEWADLKEGTRIPIDEFESIEKPPSEPLLQRLFTTKFSQYLGEISYSLYLCHNTVDHIVGTRYLQPAWDAWQESDKDMNLYLTQGMQEKADQMRAATSQEYFWKWVLAMTVNTFVLFWASDVFTRAVDAQSVKIARKLWEWVKS